MPVETPSKTAFLESATFFAMTEMASASSYDHVSDEYTDTEKVTYLPVAFKILACIDKSGTRGRVCVCLRNLLQGSRNLSQHFHSIGAYLLELMYKLMSKYIQLNPVSVEKETHLSKFMRLDNGRWLESECDDSENEERLTSARSIRFSWV